MLDFYYQLLNVEKGTSGQPLKDAYTKEVLKIKRKKTQTQQDQEQLKLLSKAYEILSNVTVKRLYDQEGKLLQMQFLPNPAYYKSFYDKKNKIDEERYNRIRNQEGKGVYYYFYRYAMALYVLLSAFLVCVPFILGIYHSNIVFFLASASGIYFILIFAWVRYFKLHREKKNP